MSRWPLHGRAGHEAGFLHGGHVDAELDLDLGLIRHRRHGPAVHVAVSDCLMSSRATINSSQTRFIRFAGGQLSSRPSARAKSDSTGIIEPPHTARRAVCLAMRAFRAYLGQSGSGETHR